MKEFLGNIDPRSKQIFSENIALMWLEDFRFKKRFCDLCQDKLLTVVEKRSYFDWANTLNCFL